MTTNSRTTPQRDRHPARGARVLTTGISVASVLGLTSAYALAAQRSTLATVNGSAIATPDSSQLAAPLATTPVVAPTQPAAAIAVAAVTQTQVASVAQAPVAQAPVAQAPVAQAPVAQAPAAPAPITIVVPQPATRSSGSK